VPQTFSFTKRRPMLKFNFAPFLLLFFALLIFSNCKVAPQENAKTTAAKPQEREIYQLKTYSLDSEVQVQTVDTYLEKAFLPGLKRQNINNIGVFKFKSNDTAAIKKLMVLIPFTSLNQFAGIEDALAKDEAYLAAGSEYLNATYKEPPYLRIETTLLKAFPDMPFMEATKVKGARKERVYELRSYESPTETYYKKKVDMFNAGGEVKLFKRLNFNAVFYADVIAGAQMPNLIYMTTFPNQIVRDSLWNEFRIAPEWTKLKAMEKYKNSVSHADIMFLYPTEYSDY